MALIIISAAFSNSYRYANAVTPKVTYERLINVLPVILVAFYSISETKMLVLNRQVLRFIFFSKFHSLWHTKRNFGIFTEQDHLCNLCAIY